MIILANDISDEPKNKDMENTNLKRAKNIICPKCKEDIKLSLKDYKINLFDCNNDHKIDNIKLNDFQKTQLIDETKIICDICKINNKSQTYNNQFNFCLECEKNICPLCKSSHDKSHSIIDYEQKYSVCHSHLEPYNSYCEKCKKDLCLGCEKEHEGHTIKSYGSMIPDIKQLKNKLGELKSIIDEFKVFINDIILKLNEVTNNYEIIYTINNNIINNYQRKNRNFTILNNINAITLNIDKVIQDINKNINHDNFNHSFKEIMEIYNQMFSESEKPFEEPEKTYEIEHYTNEGNKAKEKEKKEEKEIEKKEEKEEINYDKNEDEPIVFIHDNSFEKIPIDNNYKNFMIVNVKELAYIETKSDIFFYSYLMVLKDGRILLLECDYSKTKNHILSVYNLNTYKKDICLKYYDESYSDIEMILMKDGNIILYSFYNGIRIK